LAFPSPGFIKAMAAAGFTLTAAESILKNLAPGGAR
jgi:hypothetical protein